MKSTLFLSMLSAAFFVAVSGEDKVVQDIQNLDDLVEPETTKIDEIKNLISESNGTDKICAELSLNYLVDHILNRQQRAKYCENKCDFTDLACRDGSGYVGLPNATEVADKFKALYEWVESEEHNDALVLDLDHDIVDDMWAVSFRILPLMLSLIPIALNRWKKNNCAFLVMLGLFYLTYGIYCDIGMFTTFYLVQICGFCISLSPTAPGLVESSSSIFAMAIGICFSIVTNYYWQLAALVFYVILFIRYLRVSFFDKKSNPMVTVIYITQAFVCLEQLFWAIEEMAPNTLLRYTLTGLLGSVVPISNRANSVVIWASGNSFKIASKIAVNNSSLLYHAWFITSIVQIVVFVMFRAMLGGYLVTTLRFRFGFESIFQGLYVYMIDVFGGANLLVRYIFYPSKYNNRRLLYAADNFIFVVLEFYNCRDFFMLRLLFSSMEHLVIRSNYGQVAKYLGANISFEHCAQPLNEVLQDSFPQKGAVPWVAMDTVLDVCRYVKEVTVNRNNDCFCGEGFLVQKNGKLWCYTIMHLVRQKGLMAIESLARDITKIVKLGDNLDDPVVAIEIDDVDVYVNAGAQHIDVLSGAELGNVKSLIFIVRKEGEVYANLINSFKISHRRSGFDVNVNLRKGDSGAPVLAVMEDGNLRYAGAVSKGRSNQGSGNFVSWAIKSERGSDPQSSDDEGVPCSAKMAPKVARFNYRRNEPGFDAMCEIRDESYRLFLDEINRCKNSLLNVTRLSYKPLIEDFDCDDSVNSFKTYLGDMARADNESHTDAPRVPNNDDGDDDDQGFRSKRGKKKVKSKYKDRAARKRNLVAKPLSNKERRSLIDDLYSVRKLIRTCYTPQAGKNVFAKILQGSLPDTDRLYATVDHDAEEFIYDTDMPDNPVEVYYDEM